MLLTFLQPTIYEESIRSGLFNASDTALLSRLTGTIHTYNDSIVSFLPFSKSFTFEDKEQVDSKRIEMLRNTIHTIQANRETVAEVSKGLLNLWSFEELEAAIEAANREQKAADPRVAQLVAHIQESGFGISPAGYKGVLYDKLLQAEETATEVGTASACASLDEIIEEAQDLSGKKITPEEAEELISEAKAAKKERGCS